MHSFCIVQQNDQTQYESQMKGIAALLLVCSTAGFTAAFAPKPLLCGTTTQDRLHRHFSTSRATTTSSLPAFGEPSYGLTKTLTGVRFDDAKAKTVAALKDVGFGILTEIDLDATFRKKIDTSLDRPYAILGACNPQFAHRALSEIPAVGLLLPCNVVVTEDAEQNAVVSIVDPMALFAGIVQTPEMETMAKEIQGTLQKALDAL